MTEQLPPEAGIGVLGIPMRGGVGPPTDSPAAMIAWLYRHCAEPVKLGETLGGRI